MSKNLRELEQTQKNLEYQNDTLRVFVADVLPEFNEINITINQNNVYFWADLI